jgi:hypothetical protein
MAERIRALEPVGGFTGKSVVLAEGALYANDPGFYQRELAEYGSVTPASVRATMAKWLSRPVLAIRVARASASLRRSAANAAAAQARRAAGDQAARSDAGRGHDEVAGLPASERAQLRNGIEVVYARSPRCR